MLGQKQNPFADPLIGMATRSADAAVAVACPACTRTMTRVRTIWRAFQDDLHVFECRACSVSVSVKAPPKAL